MTAFVNLTVHSFANTEYWDSCQSDYHVAMVQVNESLIVLFRIRVYHISVMYVHTVGAIEITRWDVMLQNNHM